MSSLIEGYNYDIFISYRQKDNKGDHWVSEFVEALKTELESTFKEEISVYFDINPHDGLLETYDVDASLKEKLKCLIFIPIISRTYCDPESFAWKRELKSFVETASRDQFGLKVKLANGNVASRVLPVQIRDLDKKDIKECELILNGALRGIEFIYKEPGVNRPLKISDERNENLNRTDYRNQINKITLVIEEIISGLKEDGIPSSGETEIPVETSQRRKEKSIIVLPFENISPDPDQEYFSDGLTEEIITDLSHIHDLLVISRSSAMTFKGTKKTIPEIAQAVKVRYVLEGSVRKAGNNLRITAQLIDSVTDAHLWAEKYTGILENIFDIQEMVSGSIVKALKIELSTEERNKIGKRLIDNSTAYDSYLRAYHEIMSFSVDKLDLALKFLHKGIEIMGEHPLIYAGMALAYFQYANLGLNQEENIKKAEEFVKKSLKINSEQAEAHFVLACIYLTFHGKALDAILHFRKANSLKPDDPEIMVWLAFGYDLVGRADAAVYLTERCIEIDPINPVIYAVNGVNQLFKGRFDLALDPMLEINNLYPETGMWQFWKSIVLLYNGRLEECFEFINNTVKEPGKDTLARLTIFLKHVIRGDRDKLSLLLTSDFVKAVQIDCQLSWHIATFYSYLGENEKALDWLENAVERGFINYPFLNGYDKLLNNIRCEERFEKLMKRTKLKWENF